MDFNFYYDYAGTFHEDDNPDELVRPLVENAVKILEEAPLRVSVQQASGLLAAIYDAPNLTPDMRTQFHLLLAAMRKKLSQMETELSARP